MDSKHFDELYSNRDLRRRVDGLAYRYYSAYPSKFQIFGWDLEDLQQELWITVYEQDEMNHGKIVNMLVKDIHNMLRDSGAQIRAVDDVDLTTLAYENENGEIETDDEVMARLVYSGRGKYI